MANATARVAKGVVERLAFLRRSSETLSAETTYWQHALVGVDSTGYYCKGDDTQSWLLAGVVRPDQGQNGVLKLPAGTAGDGTMDFDVLRPQCIEIALTSVAVTDIGKPVYAVDDQTVIISPAARTYANLVGYIVDKMAANVALVALAYDGIAANARLQAARWMAATGAQTISKFDVGKTIFVPNTAALTLTLPPVADVPHGGRLQFVKTTTDAEIVTLDGDGSENIDAATTLTTIDAAYDCAELVNNGTRWVVLNRDIT